MKGRRGLNSFLLIAVVALACSCRAAGPELDFAPNPGVPEQAPLLLGALELPTPRNIVARDASHVCNDELRVAAEHLSWELMNYNAEMSEFIDGVDFTPHYTENGPIENAAVGIYDITINNYEPDEILRLLLPIHGSLDDAWIGLANFPGNHYDWLQFPVSGEVPLTGDNFNFIAPGSHGFIMAVAFTGDELFALEEFYGGSASPVAELVLECAPETQCIAGETITFTATTLDGVGMPVHEEGWDIRVPLGNTSIKLSGAPPPDYIPLSDNLDGTYTATVPLTWAGDYSFEPMVCNFLYTGAFAGELPEPISFVVDPADYLTLVVDKVVWNEGFYFHPEDIYGNVWIGESATLLADVYGTAVDATFEPIEITPVDDGSGWYLVSLTGNAYGYTEVSVISTATSCIASADLGFCAFTAQMLDSELEPTQALWGGDEFWLEVSVNQITAPQDDWNLLDLELTWELPSLVEYDSERDPVFPAELDLTVTPSEDETHRYLQLDGTYLGPGIPPPTVQIQLPMTLNDPPEDLYYEENIEVGASASLHKDAKEIEGATAAMAGAILSAVAGGALARAKAKPTHTIEVVFWVVQEPAGGTPVTYKPVVTSTEIDEDILEAHDTFEAAKKKCNMKCDYSFSITKKTMSWAKYRQLLDKNKDGKLDDFATELGARENISEGSDHYEAGKMNVYYIPKLDVGLGELTPGKSGSKEKSAMFIEKGAQGGKSTFAHETLHYVDYKNDGDFDCDDNDAATGGNGPKNLMSHNRKPRTKYPDPRKKVFNITKKQGEHLCP